MEPCFADSALNTMGAPVAGGAELHSGREGPLGLAEAVLESVLRLVEDRFSIYLPAGRVPCPSQFRRSTGGDLDC